MTKFVSISISCLILLQSFNITYGEIAEFDELIEHAKFHSEEYGDNFIVFMSKHYGELKAEHNKTHQEERQEHEKLPFNHQMHTASLSVFVLNDLPFYEGSPEFSTVTTSNFHYLANYPSLFIESAFEPPRCL